MGRHWVVLAAIAAGCSGGAASEPPPPAPPTVQAPADDVPPPDRPPPAPPADSGPAEAPGPPAAVDCQRDDDCALIARSAGGCPEPVTRSQAQEHDARMKALCAGGKGPREQCGPMPGCIQWAARPRAACQAGRCVIAAAVPAPPVDGCKRRRTVMHPACSGVPQKSPNQVGVCDGCTADTDCTARAGGRCQLAGGGVCEAAPAYVCRYPGDVCDGCPFCTNNGNGQPLCKQSHSPPPPSAPR
jgi:hypothetical protein